MESARFKPPMIICIVNSKLFSTYLSPRFQKVFRFQTYFRQHVHPSQHSATPVTPRKIRTRESPENPAFVWGSPQWNRHVRRGVRRHGRGARGPRGRRRRGGATGLRPREPGAGPGHCTAMRRSEKAEGGGARGLGVWRRWESLGMEGESGKVGMFFLFFFATPFGPGIFSTVVFAMKNGHLHGPRCCCRSSPFLRTAPGRRR